MLTVKRVYDAGDDGKRILVDRLWPRGVKKEAIDEWRKDVAPSDALRKWYNHEPKKWEEFKKRYWKELAAMKAEQLDWSGKVTLLFSTKELQYNNAVALKEYLERNT